MKKRLLITVLFVTGMMAMSIAQDPVLIIDENFQDWTASEGVVSDPPADCESTPNQDGPDVFDISYLTGGSGTMTLIKYFISPACNSKRVNQGENTENAEGVTTGFISLAKTSAETDTLGEMILSPLSNVTRVMFSYSCTSSSRGVRIFASTDGGETWENPWGEEIIGNDTKLGEVIDIPDLDYDNVMIRFTSGVDGDMVSQYSRIHDLKVWGVPGGPETGIRELAPAGIRANYHPSEGLVLRGDVSSVRIFDITGRLVERSDVPGDQTLTLAQLSQGIYILKATDSKSRLLTKKFIKK